MHAPQESKQFCCRPIIHVVPTIGWILQYYAKSSAIIFMLATNAEKERIDLLLCQCSKIQKLRRRLMALAGIIYFFLLVMKFPQDSNLS